MKHTRLATGEGSGGGGAGKQPSGPAALNPALDTDPLVRLGVQSGEGVGWGLRVGDCISVSKAAYRPGVLFPL